MLTIMFSFWDETPLELTGKEEQRIDVVDKIDTRYATANAKRLFYYYK